MCCMHEHNIAFIIYSHCKYPDKTQYYNSNTAKIFCGIIFFATVAGATKLVKIVNLRCHCAYMHVNVVTENFLRLLGFDLSHQT